MQQYEAYDERPAPTDAEKQLADRLDRLSVPLAENVLRRAITMHQAQTFDDSTIDWAAVEQIGSELGIDAETVRKALLDELETERDDVETLYDRLFAPGTVTGGIVAEADAETVADRLDEWMRDHEGMTPLRRSGSTTTWEPNRSPFAALRMFGSGRRSRGELRSAGSVTTRQTEVVGGNQLIELSADASGIRRLVVLILALYTGVGAFLGILFAANGTVLPNILEFLLPLLGGAGLGVLGAWQSARSQLKKIKRGINRALDGIVHLTTLKRRKKRKRRDHPTFPRWFDIVEEIFEEVFDD